MALVSAADAARYLEKEKVGLCVVGELAGLALEYFLNLPPAQQKPDRSLVSIADRNVELRARELLAQFDAASAHETGFIGEEFGALGSLAAAGSAAAPSPLSQAKGVWVLDPIDGTTCFLSRIPTWSVLLAYVENGVPQVGIVCFPALGEVFCASTGNGACYGSFGAEQRSGARPPNPTFVRGTLSLKDAFVSYSSPAQFAFRGLEKLWMSLGAASADFRTVSDAFGYSRVLCGGIDAMIDVIAAPYDLAAVQVLFRETPGSCFGTFFGEEGGAAFCSGGAVGACSPQILDDYRQLLEESVMAPVLAPQNGKELQTDWLGSHWLRGVFHRQTLYASFRDKKTFVPHLNVTLNAVEWFSFGAPKEAVVAGWCLEVNVGNGSNHLATAFRFGDASTPAAQLRHLATEAEALLSQILSEMQEKMQNEGAAASVDLLQSPLFLRHVDLETGTWEQVKGHCAAKDWSQGLLLVRQSVRKLDVRGMDSYEVKVRLGAVPPNGLPVRLLEPSDVPHFLAHLLSSTALLNVPAQSERTNVADASDGAAWIPVIQAASQKWRT